MEVEGIVNEWEGLGEAVLAENELRSMVENDVLSRRSKSDNTVLRPPPPPPACSKAVSLH